MSPVVLDPVGVTETREAVENAITRMEIRERCMVVLRTSPIGICADDMYLTVHRLAWTGYWTGYDGEKLIDLHINAHQFASYLLYWNHNILHPDIGCTGMPYARNVPSDHRFRSLPEPGLVFVRSETHHHDDFLMGCFAALSIP